MKALFENQLDFWSTYQTEEVEVDPNQEIVILNIKKSETRYRSVVQIGESLFFKEVLINPSFPPGHWLYTDDYCREICKECFKGGLIAEFEKGTKRCRTHGRMG